MGRKCDSEGETFQQRLCLYSLILGISNFSWQIRCGCQILLLLERPMSSVSLTQIFVSLYTQRPNSFSQITNKLLFLLTILIGFVGTSPGWEICWSSLLKTTFLKVQLVRKMIIPYIYIVLYNFQIFYMHNLIWPYVM